MSAARPEAHSILEIGSAGRALGEAGHGAESGDLHVLVPFAGGALVAVIDGLGHGSEAAAAARRAAEVLADHPGEPVASLMRHCHEGLRRTRGAVISLAAFSTANSTMSWIGVGNVEGELLRARPSPTHRREAIAGRGGVVGYQLPPLRPESLRVARGDTLIMVTDGVRSGFSAAFAFERTPQEMADAILAQYARGTDDALVMVARYLGEAAIDRVPGLEVHVPIREEADVVVARREVRLLAREQGMDVPSTEALATAVSEIAHNIVVHAGRGELAMGADDADGRHGVVVVAQDCGPGIADLDRALEDGFTTKRGLGLGLASARRLVDDFEIRSAAGRGTVVVLRKWAP